MSLHCVRRALIALAVLFALVTVLATPAAAGALRPAVPAIAAPEPPAASALDRALSLLGGIWSQAMAIATNVAGNNGVGIDPNGGVSLVGDNGAGIDPNGGQTLVGGDNGAGIDPNG